MWFVSKRICHTSQNWSMSMYIIVSSFYFSSLNVFVLFFITNGKQENEEEVKLNEKKRF